MSAGRRFRRHVKPFQPERSPANLILDEVVRRAPDVPGYGGGKWAVYSVGCCWWTSNPSTAGSTEPVIRPARFSDGDENGNVTLPGLPCCPSCGSVLMQAPLEEFVDASRAKPEHFGRGGLASFIAAHNSPCHPTWDGYLPEEP